MSKELLMFLWIFIISANLAMVCIKEFCAQALKEHISTLFNWVLILVAVIMFANY